MAPLHKISTRKWLIDKLATNIKVPFWSHNWRNSQSRRRIFIWFQYITNQLGNNLDWLACDIHQIHKMEPQLTKQPKSQIYYIFVAPLHKISTRKWLINKLQNKHQSPILEPWSHNNHNSRSRRCIKFLWLQPDKISTRKWLIN